MRKNGQVFNSTIGRTSVSGGFGMRAFVTAAMLALLALTGSGTADAPKEAPAEDLLFPLPSQEVAAR